MEPERDVGRLLLIAVDHDALERAVEQTLWREKDTDPRELVLWERRSYIPNDVGNRHVHLENWSLVAMQVMFSALIIYKLPATPPRQLGHNDDLAETFERVVIKHLQTRHADLLQRTYLKWSRSDRLLYALVSHVIHSVIEVTQSMHLEDLEWDLSEFFGANAACSVAFVVVLLRFMRQAPMASDATRWILPAGDTQRLIRQLLSDVCDLFVRFTGQMGVELNTVVPLLHELDSRPIDGKDYVLLLGAIPRAVRDRVNWGELRRVLVDPLYIGRCIAVVGNGHIRGLLALARDVLGRHNVDVIYADEQGLSGLNQQERLDDLMMRLASWRLGGLPRIRDSDKDDMDGFSARQTT